MKRWLDAPTLAMLLLLTSLSPAVKALDVGRPSLSVGDWMEYDGYTPFVLGTFENMTPTNMSLEAIQLNSSSRLHVEVTSIGSCDIGPWFGPCRTEAGTHEAIVSLVWSEGESGFTDDRAEAVITTQQEIKLGETSEAGRKVDRSIRVNITGIVDDASWSHETELIETWTEAWVGPWPSTIRAGMRWTVEEQISGDRTIRVRANAGSWEENSSPIGEVRHVEWAALGEALVPSTSSQMDGPKCLEIERRTTELNHTVVECRSTQGYILRSSFSENETLTGVLTLREAYIEAIEITEDQTDSTPFSGILIASFALALGALKSAPHQSRSGSKALLRQ